MDRLIAAINALGIQAPMLLTKVGILRSLYIEIESTKRDGYGYKDILAMLIECGFKKTTLNQFYGLMNRIRLERGAEPNLDRSVMSNKKSVFDLAPSLIYSAYSKNQATDFKTKSVLKLPTLEEMKHISREFDIDPTNFDS